MADTRIIVAGIPGAGKSTVLRELQALLPEAQIVNYGEVMLEVSGLAEEHRDRLRQLSLAEQLEVGRRAAELIAERGKGTTLVDTHCMIRTPTGYCPGLSQPVLSALKPQALVLVEADSLTILERRGGDPGRRRDREQVDDLERHRELNRAFGTSVSLCAGAALFILDNTHRSPKESAQELISCLLDWRASNDSHIK